MFLNRCVYVFVDASATDACANACSGKTKHVHNMVYRCITVVIKHMVGVLCVCVCV